MNEPSSLRDTYEASDCVRLVAGIVEQANKDKSFDFYAQFFLAEVSSKIRHNMSTVDIAITVLEVALSHPRNIIEVDE